jgi:DNA (cytosine-5)-methyltransferase 1
MRLGLELGGWKTVFANDIDADKREMYEHHFGRTPAVRPDDIHLLDVAEVPQTTLATASFPCNDLSLAGARKGLAGENSSAFWVLFAFWKKWARVVLHSSCWRM